MSSSSVPLTFADCPFVTRSVRSGGLSKRELLTALRQAGIELNEAGQALFAHNGFTTSKVATQVESVEITVASLGLVQGATMDNILARAGQLGLSLCPLELGPYLRLHYLDQPEGFLGHPLSPHTAPPGSVTIASRQLAADENTPKGFYLRRINGVLWLRGYRSGSDHVWSPGDRLVFAVSAHAPNNLRRRGR